MRAEAAGETAAILNFSTISTGFVSSESSEVSTHGVYLVGWGLARHFHLAC
jgi:hypothetical protein